MKTTLRLFVLTTFAGFSLVTGAATVRGGVQDSGTHSSASSKKAAATKAPSSQEIADARDKGLVWANLSTHVYHKNGSSMYGATKRGKFMTEEDAKKAGYRAANESGTKKAAGAGGHK